MPCVRSMLPCADEAIAAFLPSDVAAYNHRLRVLVTRPRDMEEERRLAARLEAEEEAAQHAEEEGAGEAGAEGPPPGLRTIALA